MNTTRLLNKFNNKAEQWIVDLKTIDNELLLINPDKHDWSLAEVYDHVMRVTRKYQIPNLKRSLTESALRKKRKNIYGLAIFNLGLRKDVKMKMEEFPKPLVVDFTPVKRNKSDLLDDFQNFIVEVNALQDLVVNSSNDNKQYHPMFGDINTKEWFALIELHMWLHDKQKLKIKQHLGLNL